MTAARPHLLAQAALCFEQAGQPERAAVCREKAGELVAAAGLYRVSGDLTRAASCYQRAGRTGDAVACLLALGRVEDAAALWVEVDGWLDAAWLLAVDARQPSRARQSLDRVRPRGPGEELRARLTGAVCAALERRPGALVAVLGEVEQRLAEIAPAGEQIVVTRWAVQAADQIGRPDLAAAIFATAYRLRLRGIAARWRDWARSALGGTAGIPARDL